MSENSNKYESKRLNVSLDNLYLDPNNYRLINESDYVKVGEDKIKDEVTARRTFRLLVGDKYRKIDDLVDSFRANGYLPVDQIQVRPLGENDYLVVEGNRRVAALKYIKSEYDEKGIELGKLEPEIFENVPVVLYEDADESHYMTLMALKHINGNKKWPEWNRAVLLAEMRKTLSESETCRQVGITIGELRRSLRAHSLAEQYRNSDYGDQFNSSIFPLFRDIVKSPSLKSWLDWDDQKLCAGNIENSELLFSWLSIEPVEEEGEDGETEYGDGYLEPAIIRRDDIKLLAEIIKDKKALQKFKDTRSIKQAYDASELSFLEWQASCVNTVSSELSTLGKMDIHPDNIQTLQEALGNLQSIVEKANVADFKGVEQSNTFDINIEQHFTSIMILNYKRLENLNLNRLSRINIIAGINNSGKTTLLEAIYLLSRQNDFNGLLDIIHRRGKIDLDRLNSVWFSEQLPGELTLRGIFNGSGTEVSIRAYTEDDDSIERTRYLNSVEITANYNRQSQESLTRIFKGRERETQASNIKLLCPSVFSSPFFLNEPHVHTAFYHKSVKSNVLSIICDFIRERVVPTISSIHLVDKMQRFLVSDSRFDSAIDLTEYGEGVQRIFFISLLFASAQNGVVLIDEFENAIHTDLISKFAVFIDDLSRLFNVQVFLTSHSKECIDAFVKNVPQIDDLSVCALVEENERIVPREYSGERFRRLLEAGDVDLRRAR